MLRFVTKQELWEAEAAGLDEIVRGRGSYDLKNIQDAVCLHQLRDLAGADVAEAGGGNSRLLRHLVRDNRCVNVDRFEGFGQGPTQEVTIAGVRNVRAFVGEFSSELADEAFDVTFSISVIEHVPSERLDAFFADLHRITRRGGRTIHLIDIYVADTAAQNAAATQRLQAYRHAAFAPGRFRADAPAQIVAEARFSCAWATNPDNVMRVWNRLVPGLTETRKRSQSCSLLLAGQRE